MQGPVDESYNDIQKNMVSPQSGKSFGDCSMNHKVHMRGKSGTCNVCSAPCSSCMHLKRAFMGSKTEEFSDETSRGNATSQNSANEADAVSAVKSRACDSFQPTASETSNLPSETSNLLSVNSSHDSFYENADSKAKLRSSNVPGGGTAKKDHSSPKSAERASLNKPGNLKGLEGHDDSISCVSGSSEAKLAAAHSSASMSSLHPDQSGKAAFSCSLDKSETPVAKGIDAGGNSPSSGANVLHLEQDPASLTRGKQPEFSMEHTCSLKKGLELGIVHGQRSTGHKVSLSGGSSEVSVKIYPNSEEEMDKDGSKPPDEAMICLDRDKQHKKSNELSESRNIQAPLLQSVFGNESDDESDIVEQDVKVCDICGDTGREDLLAICSRCSDGAEHTYCMRDMLQKVPEGDWLCEECKFAEKAEKQKQDAGGKRTNKESTTAQISDAEEKRTNKDNSSTQVLGKRLSENVDVASVAKKQALEVGTGSPKPSPASRTVGLSRESSFKRLEKGKVKAAYPFSSVNQPSSDTSETAHSPTVIPRLQTLKGTLSKSNSFSTISSKPKVRLVDDFVPPKQKGAREHTFDDIKEGPARTLGKSVSFRTPMSRLNASESKVKMVDMKNVRQDSKGPNVVKDRNVFERKNPTKLDRNRPSPVTTTSTTKVDQKLSSRGDTNSLSSVSNNRDPKLMQSDGISNTGTKSTSSVVRKVADAPAASVGALPENDTRNSSFVKPKDEPFSSSLAVVRPGSWEATNQDEKNREISPSQPNAAVTIDSKTAICKKCKDAGHTEEICTVGSVSISGKDTYTIRSSINEGNKGNKLKSAIQAAMMRKPELYRKPRVSDQSEETSLPNRDLNSERAFNDNLLLSNKLNNLMSFERIEAGQEIRSSSSIDSHKNIMTDLPIRPLAATSLFLKLPVIPEHEYIWQGIFELHSGGKTPHLLDGMQAHLSTCASPKVIEAVNKFPQSISLNEVPRSSTWPVQFHDSGAKEDNIALYFFARDIESYDKGYKYLLDSMIKNDLALKGNLDGVELMIFPSMQLPDKSQRWNMLYFLWGVLRGRRVNCSDSPKKIDIPSLNTMVLDQDIPAAVVPFSENLCLPKHMDKDIQAFDRSCSVGVTSIPPDLNSDSASGDSHNKESFLHQSCLGSRPCSGSQVDFIESKPSLITAQNSSQFGQGMPYARAINQPMKWKPTSSSSQASRKARGTNNIEKMQLQMEASGTIDTSSLLKIGKEVKTETRVEKTVDQMVKVKDEVKLEMEHNEAATTTTMEGATRWDFNNSKCPPLDFPKTVPVPPTSTSRSPQILPWYEQNFRARNPPNYEACTSQTNGTSSCSSIHEARCDKTCDEKVIKEDMQTATERYFFPVDSLPLEDFQLGINSVSRKGLPIKEEDQSNEVVPNLELALGAETKPPSKGMLPFFVELVDKKDDHNNPLPEKEVIAGEEDDVSASLSLSLSFPFPDKEQAVKTVSKTEQLVPERRHMNATSGGAASLLLFQGLSEK